MMRQLVAVGSLALAGLTPMCAAPASADPAAATLVAPGKITSIFVPKSDVSDIIGSAIEKEFVGKRVGKAADLGRDSDCALLVSAGAETFGKSFTAYRFQTDLDAETVADADYIVDQQVAIYEDEDTATKVFQDAFTQSVARKCDGRQVHPAAAPDEVGLELQVGPVTSTHATWSTEQVYKGDPVGWICSNQAGVQGNVLYTAMVCQFGNSGPAVAAVAGQLDSQATGVRA